MMEEEPEVKPRTSTTLKSFIKIGDYLDFPENDSRYAFSNFEIQKSKVIGTGAFSKVYQCKNIFDSKQYAVKVVSKSKLSKKNVSPDVIKSEIHIHERIRFKGIVRLYSSHEDENSFYLFLEYIKGTTLDKKIQKGLNEKEACLYFSQIVSAINFCHMHRLIFRDTKLENFIVDAQGNVKLCDFGWCAEITKEHPKRNTICGSYKYLAPEMINEQPYDYAIDIWALGILLYELIHGYSPFQSKENNYEDMIIQILKFNLVIQKEVSRNCQDLLSKMLTSNQRQRITIKEVANHPWFNEWVVPANLSQASTTAFVEDTQDKMFYDIINVVKKKNEAGKKDKKGKKNKSMATYKKIQGQEKGEATPPAKTKQAPKQVNQTIPLNFNAQDIVENDQSKVVFPIDEKDFIKKERSERVDKKELSNDQLISLLENLSGDNKPIVKAKEKRIEEYPEEEIIPKKPSNNKENIKRIFSSANPPESQDKDRTGNNFNTRPFIQIERNDHKDYFNHNRSHRIQVHNKENSLPNEERSDLQATLNLFSMAAKLKEDGKKEVIKQEPGFWDKFISPFKCGQPNDL